MTDEVRRVLAAVLVVLTALLSVVSVVADFVRSEMLDTERYVEIVAPLAREPAVQAEVVDAVTEVLRRDGRLAEELNSSLSALGPRVQNQLEEATRRAATRIVQSPRFTDLWAEANRVVHRGTLAALRDEGSALRTGDGAVRVDLGVIVAEVKQRLVESGLTLAERIPSGSSEVVLIESAELARAQSALLIFDALAPWLPFLTLVLTAAAIAVAPDRRRAVLGVGLAITAATIIVGLVLTLLRGRLITRLGATVDPAAAAVIMTAILDPLWLRLWLVGTIAALAALGALWLGPVGTRLRRRFAARPAGEG